MSLDSPPRFGEHASERPLSSVAAILARVMGNEVVTACEISKVKVAVVIENSGPDLDASLTDTCFEVTPGQGLSPRFARIPEVGVPTNTKENVILIRIDFDFLTPRMALTCGPRCGPISGIVHREYPSRYLSHAVIHWISGGDQVSQSGKPCQNCRRLSQLLQERLTFESTICLSLFLTFGFVDTTIANFDWNKLSQSIIMNTSSCTTSPSWATVTASLPDSNPDTVISSWSKGRSRQVSQGATTRGS